MRKKLFGQEDHVRRYSIDYRDRLENAGFKVDIIRYSDSLDPLVIKKYVLFPEGDSSIAKGWIYRCSK